MNLRSLISLTVLVASQSAFAGNMTCTPMDNDDQTERHAKSATVTDVNGVKTAQIELLNGKIWNGKFQADPTMPDALLLSPSSGLLNARLVRFPGHLILMINDPSMGVGQQLECK